MKRIWIVSLCALALAATALAGGLALSAGSSVRRGIAWESGNGWIYFTPLRGTDPVRLGRPRRLARGSDPVLSPDGRTVVFARFFDLRNKLFGSLSSRLYSISSDGGEPKPLRGTETYSGDRAYVSGPIAWSPDSRHLAVGASVIDVRSGKVERNTDGAYPSFSPDGRSLIYAGGPGLNDLYVADLKGGKTQRVTDLGDAYSPVWGPKEIAFNRDNEIWLIDGNGKHLHRLGTGLIVSELYGSPVSWSADGRLLLTFAPTPNPTLSVVQTAGGNVIYSATADGGGLSRDGKLVLIDTCNFSYPVNAPHGIVIVSLNGHHAARLVSSGCNASWNA